ncbi:hypothetical protein BDQ12DRAFT_674355 [Crucibulum laeve]|uniref:Uncharacterized protein n=1 Tax=Crucibulum laeve TaxID=68775 RepID=A0A5C3MGP4_9AGAR|nr:hypothetical protein BDQ12DRAFT_674355 [Crucibulum laeve]
MADRIHHSVRLEGIYYLSIMMISVMVFAIGSFGYTEVEDYRNYQRSKLLGYKQATNKGFSWKQMHWS